MKKQILGLLFALSFSTSCFAKKKAFGIVDVDEDTTFLQVFFPTRAVKLRKVLENNPNLTHLSINLNDINPKTISSLAGVLNHGRYITHIGFHSCSIQLNIIPAIKTLTKTLLLLPNLTSLDFSSNFIENERAIKLFKILSRFSFLTSLNLSNNRIGAEEINKLTESLKHYPYLVKLDFYGNHMGPAGAIAVAELLQDHTNIKYLDMGSNRIGNNGIIILTKSLQNNPNLEYLDLGHSEIDNTGAIALLEILNNDYLPNLIYLRLSHNKMNNGVINAISIAIGNHKKIETYHGRGYDNTRVENTLKRNRKLRESGYDWMLLENAGNFRL